MDRHIVIFSGGLDSYILLRWVMTYSASDHEVSALTFLYGQRNIREIHCAQKAAHKLGAPHRLLDIGNLARFGGNSAMTNPDIALPKGADALASTKVTTIPGRNTIMLGVALAHAEGSYPGDLSSLYYGATADDWNTPDCRAEYANAMSHALLVGSDHHVSLSVPFLGWTKTNILMWALNNGVTLDDLANTWSCYDNQPVPCGQCRVCLHRADAFKACGVPDPSLFTENR